MKRVAESQLTKDARDDGEEEEEETGSGFKRADPSALSERKIRGLPKRAGVLTTSASASPDPITPASTQPASRFGGFGGFGGFAASTTSHLPSTTGTQPLSSDPFGSAQPKSQSPAPQNTLNPDLVTYSTDTSVDTQTSESDTTKSEAARNYYLALHGLNKSFLHSVKKAVEIDPFTNIGEFFEKYKSFRESAQKEFEGSTATDKLKKNGLSTLSPSTSTAKAAPSMPTSPASFSFGFKPATTSKDVSSSGFKPTTTGSNSPASFSFGLKTTTASSGGFKPTSTASSSASDKPLAFSFGQDRPADKPFVFGNSTATANTPSDNEAVKAAGSPSVTSATLPATPGISPFSTPSKLTTTSDDSSSVAKTGAIAPTPLSPSTSGFRFGTGKSSSATSPFGSPGNGSIGNPVGFAFASSQSTPQVTEPPASATNPSDTTEGADVLLEASMPPANPYDLDGPGEENETTVYETKCSANKFVSVDDKKKYVKVGTGLLKLKRHNDTRKLRLLMRNSSTGHIILNFSLHPGFTITVDKKDITFRVPGERDDATIYRLRLAVEVDAAKWPTVVREE